MPAAPVRFLPQAIAEVEEAEAWYLERSPAAASAFVREFERGILLIAETPAVWPSFEAGTRRHVLHKYPFSILYRPGPEFILVVAVMHHSRRPGYWHGR